MTAPTDDEVRALGRLAFAVAYRILRNAADAEDIAQEAVTRTAVRWRRVRDYPEAFVQRVATNLAIGLLRRSATASRHNAEQRSDARSDPRHDDLPVADRLDLAHAIARLPRRQREVVTLRYLADLPERDVASILGVSPGSVKQHATRGLSSLRSALTPRPEPPALRGASDA